MNNQIKIHQESHINHYPTKEFDEKHQTSNNASNFKKKNVQLNLKYINQTYSEIYNNSHNETPANASALRHYNDRDELYLKDKRLSTLNQNYSELKYLNTSHTKNAASNNNNPLTNKSRLSKDMLKHKLNTLDSYDKSNKFTSNSHYEHNFTTKHMNHKTKHSTHNFQFLNDKQRNNTNKSNVSKFSICDSKSPYDKIDNFQKIKHPENNELFGSSAKHNRHSAIDPNLGKIRKVKFNGKEDEKQMLNNNNKVNSKNNLNFKRNSKSNYKNNLNHTNVNSEYSKTNLSLTMDVNKINNDRKKSKFAYIITNENKSLANCSPIITNNSSDISDDQKDKKVSYNIIKDINTEKEEQLQIDIGLIPEIKKNQENSNLNEGTEYAILKERKGSNFILSKFKDLINIKSDELSEKNDKSLNKINSIKSKSKHNLVILDDNTKTIKNSKLVLKKKNEKESINDNQLANFASNINKKEEIQDNQNVIFKNLGKGDTEVEIKKEIKSALLKPINFSNINKVNSEPEKEICNFLDSDLYSVKFDQSIGSITENIKVFKSTSKNVQSNMKSSKVTIIPLPIQIEKKEEKKKPKKTGCFFYCF